MKMPAFNSPERQRVVGGLAVVGFIALIIAGIWLAFSAAALVPRAVSRIGSAAVYLGSMFTPASKSSLLVIPTPMASTTISFGTTDATTSTSRAIVLPRPAAPRKPAQTTAGTKTSGAFALGSTGAGALSGLPDLAVNVSAIGYLSAASTDSFTASSTVPAGSRPAIKFTIKNIGTNATGSWRFSASIPTQTNFLFQSQPQQSLNPGDSIDYTLGFDQSNRGSNQIISITANFDNAVTESTTSNNKASATITVFGS